MTTFRQHLHASDMVSPNCGCGEEPSSVFSKFIPKGSLGEGMGWWSPALPARPWLFHLHPPEGRVHSPLPPHQPTSPVGQQRALPETRGPLGLRDTGPGKQQCGGCSLQSRAHVVPNSLQPSGTTSPAPRSGCTVLVFLELPWQKSPSFLVRAKNLLHFVRNQQGAFLDLA